jgi:hypothetical protein
VIPLVAVSGADCIEALVRAGFDARTTDDGITALVRDGRVVVVPTSPLLSPGELLAVLEGACVAYSDFLDLLCETPTDPDVRAPAIAQPARPSW